MTETVNIGDLVLVNDEFPADGGPSTSTHPLGYLFGMVIGCKKNEQPRVYTVLWFGQTPIGSKFSKFDYAHWQISTWKTRFEVAKAKLLGEVCP